MDLSETQTLVTVVCGIAILIGVVGVIVPMLPGLLLAWAGVLAWALLSDRGWGKWVVLGIASVLAAVAIVIKYAWPGRNLKRSGVPNRSLIVGGVLGLIGFFVIPVVGLVIGFILGIWLAERIRLNSFAAAWPSTKQALRAAGLAMLIELGAALLVAAVWLAGVFLT